MKKITAFAIIGFISLFYSFAYSQIIDNYGIRIGGGLSNQYWDYKNNPDYSSWKEDLAGLQVYVNAEKQFNKYLSLRPELGYIQKGFIDEITFTDVEGNILDTDKSDIEFHNLSLNLILKISAFETKIKPYLIAGFRGDYMLSYEDHIIEIEGVEYGIYHDMFDEFNKFTLGGLIGIGCEFGDLMYLDIEYNPAITNNYSDNGISIRDRYFGVTIGANISSLF